MHQIKTICSFRFLIATSVTLLSLVLFLQHANAQIVTLGSTASQEQSVGSVTDRTVVFNLTRKSFVSPQTGVVFHSDFPDLLGRPNSCPIPSPPITLPSSPASVTGSPPVPPQYRLDSPPKPYNPNTENYTVSNCGNNNANWILRNWQIRTGTTGGKVQLKLFKQPESANQAANLAQVISVEPIEETQPNQLNTFPIERPLTDDEFKQVEGFGVSVIGTGPEPFTARTDKPQFELGIADVPGNFAVGTFLDISRNFLDISNLDTTKQPNVALTLESDLDRDGVRDSIDDDVDNDGTPNATDNCRWQSNTNQEDTNKNGVGTACDNVEPWEKWRDQLLTSDNDRDGLPFNREMQIKTDVCDRDSDDDGISDGKELKRHTKPTLFDTDHDRLSDGLESGVSKPLPLPHGQEKTCLDSRPNRPTYSPLNTSNLKRFRPDRDPKTKTNPLRSDTDRDGTQDGKEDKNHNGRVDRGERNPRRSNK